MKRIKYRSASLSDVQKILDLEQRVWGKNAATLENIQSRIGTFPEGNIIGLLGNKVVGYVGTVIISKETESRCKTWYDYTDNGNGISVYDPQGTVLFGISLTVDNSIRNQGIGSNLLLNVARLAIENNLEYGILGGRLPYYYKKREMQVSEYAKLVNEKGKIFDPELRLYKRMGLQVVKFQEEYFNDPESLNYGVILKWKNPFYRITKIFPFLTKQLSLLFRI